MFTYNLEKENRRHKRPSFWESKKHTACCNWRVRAYYGTAQCFDTGGLACFTLRGKMYKILVIAGCRTSRAGGILSFLASSKVVVSRASHALLRCSGSCGGKVWAHAHVNVCIHTLYCIWHLRTRRKGRRQWTTILVLHAINLILDSNVLP